MANKKWLIYGANGYTGVLVAQEALQRGHKPVLAGRTAQKLASLAEKLGLDMLVFDLQNANEVAEKIADFDLVFHAAGPFIHTSLPMVRACLKTQTHYLDITGEISVFEQNFAFDAEARTAGIAIISGVGFDVVPSDCLLNYVAGKIQNASHLELAFASPQGTTSAGTTKTMIEHLPKGVFARRNGELQQIDPQALVRTIRFADRERTVMPISWGDLATAYRSTGVPNISVFAAMPPKVAARTGKILPIARKLLKIGFLRKLAQAWVVKNVKGPDAKTRQTARCYFWAQASNQTGDKAEAWLETPEGYHLTAVAGVCSVEKIFELQPTGALTPAQAFGVDFVLELPDVERFDRLPESAT